MVMKKIFLYFVMVALTAIVLPGCTKDWLKPNQPSKLNSDNAYSTVSGCQALVNKLCKDLRPEVMGRDGNMKWAYEGSDLAVLVNGSPRDLDGMLVPSITSKPKSFWDDAWKSISRSALLVSRSQTVDASQGERDQLKAYGEFFLAYWYFRLITTYGDVPLYTSEINYPARDFVSSTKQRIISTMIPMLEEAVKNLPPTANAGQVSGAAANMLLTKYYLMDGQFDKAVASATAVINTPGLALMTARFGALSGADVPKIPSANVMTDLFYKYNPSLAANTEKILVVLNDPSAAGGTLTVNGGGMGERMREYLVEWYNGQYDQAQAAQQRRTSGVGVRSTIDGGTGGPGPFTIAPTANLNLQILWTGRGIGAQKKTWYFSHAIWANPAFALDMRHKAPNWYAMEALVYNVKTSSLYGKNLTKANCSDTMRCWDDIQYNKVVVDNENQALTDYNLLGGFQDWYIYRLAEAYLMRAEAQVWLGHGDLAANDINVIRARANALPLTGNATLDDVLDERARELFLEEFRRNELVRIAFTMAKLNMNGYTLANIGTKNWFYDRLSKKNNIFFDTSTGQPGNFAYGDNNANVQIYRMSPFHIFWPIPETAINDNKLARLNQNYGYTGYDKNIPPLE